MTPQLARPAPDQPTTVIICSRYGGPRLAQVLTAARTSLEAARGGDLILVDSASSPEVQVAMRRAAEQVDARVITMSRSGKSRALNAGMAHAAHDVFLFTDDDVIVPTQWVSDMTAPLRMGHHLVTGAVHLSPDVALGLSDTKRELLADSRYMNLGDGPPRTIIGASMGLHRDAFDHGFRFQEQIGAGALGFMEETLMHLQVREAGGTTKYVKSAPVLHHPSRTRLTDAAWHARSYAQGACEAWVAHHWFHDSPTREEWTRFAAAEVRWASRPVRGSEPRTLDLARRRGAGRWWAGHRFSSRCYARRGFPAPLS